MRWLGAMLPVMPDVGRVDEERPWSAAPGVRGLGEERALFALAALPGPYLPWGSGAMRPAGLVAVCNDIVVNDRRHVVELGSGVSTVILARLFNQLGGPERRLVAVEHDATWRSWVTGQLAREGIDGCVDVVAAPLSSAADGEPAWYDEAVIDAAVDVVDLLVVDGPPAFEVGFGLARRRALPALRGRLVPGASVVLDDIERDGEQEVLRGWENEFGLVFRPDLAAGVAIATVP
jgi:hypothetical protein